MGHLRLRLSLRKMRAVLLKKWARSLMRASRRGAGRVRRWVESKLQMKNVEDLRIPKRECGKRRRRRGRKMSCRDAKCYLKCPKNCIRYSYYRTPHKIFGPCVLRVVYGNVRQERDKSGIYTLPISFIT